MGKKPLQVRRGNVLWLKNNDSWNRIGVFRRECRKQLFRQRFSCLDQHGRLIAGFNAVLPPIDGHHARKNIYTGCELFFHKFLAYLPCVDFTWKCGINYDHSGIFIHGSQSSPSYVPQFRAYNHSGCDRMTHANTVPAGEGVQPDKARIGFVASPAAEAQAALKSLTRRYGGIEPEEADIVVALGGDGLMLQTLHRFLGTGVPIYGMHRGSVGFLMNEFHENELMERVARAKLSVIHPLKMVAENVAGETLQALAINEVHLYRQTAQSARLTIAVDGKERMSELLCDGVLVATPAGSTAYNLSVGGPILPLKAHLLALTPISPFRPRRWRGALLPNKAEVRIEAHGTR